MKVDNIFLNTKIRDQISRSHYEEYLSIVRLVQAYSLQYPAIEFSLSKSYFDVPDIYCSSNESFYERIEILFGTSCAKSLLSFEICAEHFRGKFHASSVEYSLKKTNSFIFINSRIYLNTRSTCRR